MSAKAAVAVADAEKGVPVGRIVVGVDGCDGSRTASTAHEHECGLTSAKVAVPR